jgi:hypothetical protein
VDDQLFPTTSTIAAICLTARGKPPGNGIYQGWPDCRLRALLVWSLSIGAPSIVSLMVTIDAFFANHMFLLVKNRRSVCPRMPLCIIFFVQGKPANIRPVRPRCTRKRSRCFLRDKLRRLVPERCAHLGSTCTVRSRTVIGPRSTPFRTSHSEPKWKSCRVVHRTMSCICTNALSAMDLGRRVTNLQDALT